MSVKIQRILNITMVLISLSTVPLMGLQNIKRFLPVSILIGTIEVINALIGKKRRWWVFYNKPNSFLFNEFPFNIGAFLVISLWLMTWSYGKFIKFILLMPSVMLFLLIHSPYLQEKLNISHWYVLIIYNFSSISFSRHFCFMDSNIFLKGTKSLLETGTPFLNDSDALFQLKKDRCSDQMLIDRRLLQDTGTAS